MKVCFSVFLICQLSHVGWELKTELVLGEYILVSCCSTSVQSQLLMSCFIAHCKWSRDDSKSIECRLNKKIGTFERARVSWESSSTPASFTLLSIIWGVTSVHPSPGLKLSIRWYFVFFLKLPCRGVPADKIQWSVLRGAHSGLLYQCQGGRKTVFLYRITSRILCVFYNELPIME